MTDYPKITAYDVLDLVQLFDRHQIDLHIDGGWGVDALLGRQTRTHADLDIRSPAQRCGSNSLFAGS
jgi:Aminoglycoside-2''-adenylyltransferase